MEMIKLTINGKEVTGKKGDTILTIAAQNGIAIPNLCYNKKLKIYGSCGLCVVEAENSGQFDIADHRSVQEMTAALAAIGYQAVTKDWEAV